MIAYYNENDPFATAWLRELIKENLIAPGEVDERSIKEVAASDLRGFTQVHLFAGIGGWSYALRLAGWPDDRAVWTGSCPCQPFSVAGKRGGTSDDRHLWPEMRRLLSECRPATAFGEQVASKDGRLWLAGVRADLEALGYAVGAADLCAAGVGSPHIRQRLWWVADSAGDGWQQRRAESNGRSFIGDSLVEHTTSEQMGPSRCPWQSRITVDCVDGKARRVEPSIQPLAHGVSNRVGLLRGAGNAIVPQVAAEFIRAFVDA